jgi:hypothetical protein
LIVRLQDLFTLSSQFGTVFLQAGEDGKVALIDHWATETLHVAGAGLLLLGRTAAPLRERAAGHGQRQQADGQDKSEHSVPYITLFDGREFATGKYIVSPTWIIRIATVADWDTNGSTSAGKCGQIEATGIDEVALLSGSLA